jgi:hypothetical protein
MLILVLVEKVVRGSLLACQLHVQTVFSIYLSGFLGPFLGSQQSKQNPSAHAVQAARMSHVSSHGLIQSIQCWNDSVAVERLDPDRRKMYERSMR